MRPNETTWCQLCLLLFVLTGSIGAFLWVGRVTSEEVCDYTDVVDSCDEQPLFRTQDQLHAAMHRFGDDWLFMAQELRNESEIQKCEIEQRLMEDLMALHRREAQRIVDKCHRDFQRCVNEGRGTTTTTRLITTTRATTTTAFDFTTTATTSPGTNCLSQALAGQTGGGEGTSNFIDCVTNPGNEPPHPVPPSTTTTTPAFYDCTVCDRFCAAFNWTQLDPAYAALMGYNYAQPCGETVCPWTPQCTVGPPSLNLHPNCSARGCTCLRAQCIPTTTTTTTNAVGGRRLPDEPDERWQSELDRMLAEAADRRLQAGATTTTTTIAAAAAAQPHTTTTTTEDLVNNTLCTCKPGYVTTVLVGRPYRVFYSDPTTWNNSRLRRLAGGRSLNDPSLQVQLAQGVEVTMEEELIEDREQTYDCREYFSDRFKYVYPKTVGDEHSFEAMLARLSHADLGCGYTGEFKVKCVPGPYRNETYDGGNGTCSYKVDISTCVPPSYDKAVDSCYLEEAGGLALQPSMPAIDDWLETEDVPSNTSGYPEEFKLPTPSSEECCDIHVSSECVLNREFPDYGTKNGTWEPDRSYSRQTPYFQRVFCSQQAQLKEHSCPRVKIKRLAGNLGNGRHQADLNPECFRVCNITSVNEELNQSCHSTVEDTTRILQQNALNAKINSMKAHRNQLQAWSRRNWPRVLETTNVLDCVAEMPRRWNRLGYPKRRSDTFEKLKLRYECRIHSCSVHQCLKVTKPCKIDHMDGAFENTCGPFGEEYSYTCMPKVEIISTSVGFLTGYGFFGCSFFCLLSSFAIFIKSFLKKNAKVAPVKHHSLHTPVEPLALQEGPRPSSDEVDPPQLALADSEFRCSACGHINDPTDQNCVHCGAPRTEPTTVLATPASLNQLRDTANSPNNEMRIQPVTTSTPIKGFE